MADLSIAIDTSLARDLFSSLDYPYRMRVGNKLLADDMAALDFGNEAELDWDADVDQWPDDQVSDFDAGPMLEAMIDGYLEKSGTEKFLVEDDDAEASALVAPYASGIDFTGADAIAQVLARMDADSAFEAKATAFFQSRLGGSVDWVEAELSEKPDVAMGNPLTLSRLRFAVRARLKGCIRVFGRQICVSVTTPWIRFEGRRAALFFDVVGTRILGRAKVSDIDFVWRIRILSWTVTIRVGVTGIINSQLASQRPVLADFSTVAIAVPGVNRTYRPNAIAVPASGTETRVEVDGDFKRS